MTQAPLDGARVLVTRPAHQAPLLCRQLRDAGAQALAYPALAIEPITAGDTLERALAQLPEQQLLVFTSPNAVDYFHQLLSHRGLSIPRQTLGAAVGRGTGDRLQNLGMPRVVVAPSPYTSEALLTRPELRDLDAVPVTLVSGEGGRGVLAEQLRQQGARLTKLAVYRRICPPDDPGPLRQWLVVSGSGVIINTSGEALDNLITLAGAAQRAALLATDLITVSPRLRDRARKQGFHGEVLIAEPADAALVQGVVRWWHGSD